MTSPDKPATVSLEPRQYSFGSKTKPRRDTETSLKLVQWNIERGYQLQHIQDLLESLEPDVCCLQELDIGCKRSAGKDTVQEISQALQMNAVFAPEFQELTEGDQALHGNAILSRYPLRNVRVLEHRYQPFHWQSQGHAKNEPRLGQRRTLSAVIDTPAGPLLAYSVHLEVYCGVVGRLAMLSEILADASNMSREFPKQILFGDFNTMQQGIARLSRQYCTDCLRWRLPASESEWLHDNVIAYTVEDGPTNSLVQAFFYEHVLPYMKPIPFLWEALEREQFMMTVSDYVVLSDSPPLSPVRLPDSQELFPPTVQPLRYQAELDSMFTHLRNPGFYEVFDVKNDVTLQAYRGLYQGKLDWCLVRELLVRSKSIHNHDYAASDHKLLLVEVEVDRSAGSKLSKQIVDDVRQQRLQLHIQRDNSVSYWRKSKWSMLGLTMGSLMFGWMVASMQARRVK